MPRLAAILVLAVLAGLAAAIFVTALRRHYEPIEAPAPEATVRDTPAPAEAPRVTEETASPIETVLVSVVDELDRAPLSGAWVRLGDWTGPVVVAEDVTDSEGKALLRFTRTDRIVWATAGLRGYLPTGEIVRPGASRVGIALERGLPVAGRVVHQITGEGVASLPVRVFLGSRNNRIEVVETDGTGNFEVEAVDPEGGFLFVSALDAFRLDVQDETRSEEGITVTLEAIPLARIEGRVLDDTGEPVHGADVVAVRLDGDDPSDEEIDIDPSPRRGTRGSASTTEDGSFRLVGLDAPGTYRVGVWAPDGASTVREAVSLTGPGDVQRCDFTVTRASISLVVTVVGKDETPLAGARLLLTAPHDEITPLPHWGRFQFERLTDERGAAEFLLPDPGEYSLEIEREGATEPRRPVWVERGIRNELRVFLEDDPVLEGVVEDREGRPVLHAGVHFKCVTEDASVEWRNTTTDSEGRFRIVRAPAGPGDLYVGGPQTPTSLDSDPRDFGRALDPCKYSAARIQGVVPGGEPLRIVLPPPVRIAGRIVPPPKAGVASFYTRRGDDPKESPAPWERLDEEGGFEICVPSDETRIHLAVRLPDERWCEVGPLFALPGERIDLGDLVFDPPRTLVGVILDTERRPCEGTIAIDSTRLRGSLRGTAASRRVRTDATGRFVLEELPPGRATLTASGPGFVTTMVEVDVDATPFLEVIVPRRAIVRGTSLRADGSPCRHNLLFEGRTAGGDPDAKMARVIVFPENDGSFQVKLVPGTYRITARLLLDEGTVDVAGPTITLDSGGLEELALRLCP